MTTDNIIRTTRKKKRGEAVPVHYYRPQRDFKRTLDGVDTASPAYQRSLMKAIDGYTRWLATGSPKKATVRKNAKGSPIDDLGMVVTMAPRGTLPVEPESIAWLAHWFMRHPQWKALKSITQARWGSILRRFLAEPWPAVGPDAVIGDAAFASLRKSHMLALRSRFAHIPSQANVMAKAVRAMFYAGQEAGIVTTVNPAAMLGQLQEGSHKALNYQQHLAYTKRWPVGTVQRLAYDMILYTGVRVTDLHMLGPQHVENGWMVWTENKGKDSTALKRRAKENKDRNWKLHPDLLSSIAATAHGIRTFILRGDGQPYAQPDRLGRAIAKWMQAAGIKDRSAHSVRKFGAVALADCDADLILLRDFLGHASFQEAETYIRDRNRRRTSIRAVDMMDVVKAMKAAS